LPGESGVVVVTVTGVPFTSNVPAPVPITVIGAVAPPPYAVKARKPADAFRPLPKVIFINVVAFEPVAFPFKACPGLSANGAFKVATSKIVPLPRMMFGELAIEPPALNLSVPPRTVVSPE
jgi:hypothetical protein